MIAAVAIVAGGGCGHRRPAERRPAEPRPDKFDETVRGRASFDLSCPADQLTIVNLGETTRGARGCDRQASYSCLCTYHVWYTCTQAVCTLDGTSTSLPTPQPPATPPARDPS